MEGNWEATCPVVKYRFWKKYARVWFMTLLFNNCMIWNNFLNPRFIIGIRMRIIEGTSQSRYEKQMK